MSLVMSVGDFHNSLEGAAPPPGITAPLQALWWDARGDWARAHALVMDDPSEAASLVHAYLHRKEGDAGNAAYWYRRARRPAGAGALGQEWEALTAEFLGVAKAAG